MRLVVRSLSRIVEYKTTRKKGLVMFVLRSATGKNYKMFPKSDTVGDYTGIVVNL